MEFVTFTFKAIESYFDSIYRFNDFWIGFFVMCVTFYLIRIFYSLSRL